MAREVIEKLIDDLDGGEAAETVSFGLDGTTYEIDLSKKNAAALRKAVEGYVNAARAGSRGSGRRKVAAAPASRKAKRDYDIGQLREWAGTNGVAVPARGRIPQAVVDRYKAAGNT